MGDFRGTCSQYKHSLNMHTIHTTTVVSILSRPLMRICLKKKNVFGKQRSFHYFWKCSGGQWEWIQQRDTGWYPLDPIGLWCQNVLYICVASLSTELGNFKKTHLRGSVRCVEHRKKSLAKGMMTVQETSWCNSVWPFRTKMTLGYYPLW